MSKSEYLFAKDMAIVKCIRAGQSAEINPGTVADITYWTFAGSQRYPKKWTAFQHYVNYRDRVEASNDAKGSDALAQGELDNATAERDAALKDKIIARHYRKIRRIAETIEQGVATGLESRNQYSLADDELGASKRVTQGLLYAMRYIPRTGITSLGLLRGEKRTIKVTT